MKIIVSSCDTKSLATFRLDMMLYFVEKGHTVYAIGNEDEDKWCEFFSNHNIQYLSVACNRNGTNIKEDMNYFLDLKRIFNALNPDFIFTYQLKSNLYTGFAKPKKARLMVLFAGLGTVFMTDTLKNKLMRKMLYIPLKLSMNNSDYILFHNHDNRSKMVESKLVQKKKSYVVNGSGVNLQKFPYVDNHKEEIHFLYLGRILKDKGVIEYMEASKRIKEDHPNLKFSIVGNFDTNPSSLSLEDIEPYQKYINYFGETDNPFLYFKEATVFVYPSYHEGLPKSVIEAMSVGRPIITTDVPGCRETVIDGKNGYLISKKDINALEEAMRKFINMHPKERCTMGKMSRRMAEEKFSVEIINKEIYRIMDKGRAL